MERLNNIQLIGTDLDGTLLNKAGTMHPATAQALRDAAEAGIHIVPASARPPFGIEYALKEALVFDFIIAYNGTYIVDRTSRKVLLDLRIDEEKLEELLSLVRRFNLYTGFYVGDDYFAEIDGASAASEAYYLGRPPKILPSLDPLIRQGANKLIILEMKDYDRLDAFGEAAQSLNGLEIVYSSRRSIEIVPQGVSKGTGLRFLSDMLSLSPDQVMAIGDNFNDVPMFQFAGVSVAMKNAPDAVKEQTDFTVRSSEEGGVAEAINRLLEQRRIPKG
ncbi:MAG TPA: HAD family phosphatase [Chloroflexi bacterium]|nr:HAD family phosphatase [Chloroflexota bacterium]HPO57938.1 Cof-type HAD-IIB family hydrolase [Anaerolineaceae bacterium]